METVDIEGQSYILSISSGRSCTKHHRHLNVWICLRILKMNVSYSVFNWPQNFLRWISLSWCTWHLENEMILFSSYLKLYPPTPCSRKILNEFPIVPSTALQQQYTNTQSSVDLVGIHSSLTKCVIHICESFVSTYQTTHQTHLAATSLCLSTCVILSAWNSLISVYLSLKAGSLCLPSTLTPHQAFCNTPVSFWYCTMNGLAEAC